MERKITSMKTKKKKLNRDPLIMRRKKKLKRDPVNLDPDLHLEIISRLPFEKAVQCRCVCKSWRTLLDDNFLINIHAKSLLKLDGYDHHHAHSSSSSIVSFISFPHKKTTLFGFYDDNLCSYNGSSFNDSSFNFINETMINSCNGLICLNTNYYSRSISIYNPVTGEFLRLPCWDTPVTHNRPAVVHGCLGYNPSTKEYKVLITIRIPWILASHRHQIYTLGTTDRWRNVESLSDPYFNKFDVPGVHVNGALYWITGNREYGGNKKREMIMSFDLANEEFRILTTLPPHLYDMKPQPHYKLVESQGCLFLFVDQYFTHDYHDPHLELWVMKEKENDHDHNGYSYYWSNFMEISTVGYHKEGKSGDYEFLALTQSGKVLFWHKGVLISFDPKTERFDSISDGPLPSSDIYGSGSAIVSHTNSLVSLIALGVIPKNNNKKKDY